MLELESEKNIFSSQVKESQSKTDTKLTFFKKQIETYKNKAAKAKKNAEKMEQRVNDQEKIIKNFARIQEGFDKERKQHVEQQKKLQEKLSDESVLKAMLEKLDKTN